MKINGNRLSLLIINYASFKTQYFLAYLNTSFDCLFRMQSLIAYLKYKILISNILIIVEICEIRNIFLPSVKETIMKMLENVRISSWQKGKTASDVLLWYEWMVDILEHSELVTIYDSGGDDSDEDNYFDAAILKALFKSTSNEMIVDRGLGELKLALAINRIDMIKGTIFDIDSSDASNCRLTTEDFAYVLPLALQKDRVEFVKEFMKYGLMIPDYLSRKRLVILYNKYVCILSASDTKYIEFFK